MILSITNGSAVMIVFDGSMGLRILCFEPFLGIELTRNKHRIWRLVLRGFLFRRPAPVVLLQLNRRFLWLIIDVRLQPLFFRPLNGLKLLEQCFQNLHRGRWWLHRGEGFWGSSTLLWLWQSSVFGRRRVVILFRRPGY